MILMSNYDVDLTNDYITRCTNKYKHGMYPTFDILFKHIEITQQQDIIPTEQNSKIIESLMEYFTYNEIVEYFREVFGYRNCCIPLSIRYPDLFTITSRIRFMWKNHDVANTEKFNRIIQTITDSMEISPLYRYHKKYDYRDTQTPNVTNTLTKTGTESESGSETLSGSDTSQGSGSGSETITNGVTSYDSNEFVNNDNQTSQSSNSNSNSITYGKSTAKTDTTTYNTTETDRKTGTDKTDGSGNEWYSDLSLAEIQQREIALNTILDLYFHSVAHDICLSTLEDIW